MRNLKQTYTINAPKEKVWHALVNPESINDWGAGPAEMTGKEGRREGGKEGRREGGKEGRREGGKEENLSFGVEMSLVPIRKS